MAKSSREKRALGEARLKASNGGGRTPRGLCGRTRLEVEEEEMKEEIQSPRGDGAELITPRATTQKH